jgi:hypothetical protein
MAAAAGWRHFERPANASIQNNLGLLQRRHFERPANASIQNNLGLLQRRGK